MKRITRAAFWVPAAAGLLLSGKVSCCAEPSGNLIANGGFENGCTAWSWGEGLPQPGFVDQEKPATGKACFVMGLTGVEGVRRMSQTVPVDPASDYELSLTLRGSDLPEKSVQVALLEWGTEKSETPRPQGWVWLPELRGVRNLLETGGSFDWRGFKIHIYRQGIKPSTKKVTLYIEHSPIDQGELGIDDVCMTAVAPVEYQKPAAPAAKPAPAANQPAPKPEAKVLPQPPALPVADNGPVECLLVDRGDSLDRWSRNLGPEFPGAAGEVSVETVDDRSVLQVAYDLSGGGRYAGAQCKVDIPKADALVLDVLAAGRRYFDARILDASGQTHSGGFRTAEGKWETVELPLSSDTFHSHWGGPNDGMIHFPLRQVLIAASSTKGERGVFHVRDLGMKTRDLSQTWRIGIASNQPGQIHFTDDPAIQLTVTVENRLRKERTGPVSIEVSDLDGHLIASQKVERKFAAWQRQTIELPVTSLGVGYFPVRVTVCGESVEGAFGVVRKPQRFRQRDPDSFFALHVSDPEVAARLGVHSSRYFHFWRYTESHQGKYEHATNYVDACRDAGIDVMMCLDYREPSWLKPATRENGLPTDEAVRHYANWVRDAVRAHPGVLVFEIQNEPDLELGWSRNLPFQAGVDFYSQLVETAAPIIRQDAPHALIVGCSVSGRDYDDNFSYSKPVLERVGKLLDIYAGHPYASPRIFGPGLHPSWPAANREVEKNQAALEVLRPFETIRKTWIGEKGWAITSTSSMSGDAALSFAHCLAQSLIEARSVPGIGKYFWFLQRQQYGSEGGDYTLFRGDVSLQPMPAAVAYANVARHLDHCRPVESFHLGGDVRVSIFERTEDRGAVAVLWSVDKPFLLETNLPADVGVFDLFGRDATKRDLSVTAAPFFMSAASSDARTLIAAIRAGTLKPAQPFEVVSVSTTDVKTLRVRLINRTHSTFPVQGSIGEQSKRFILPGVSEPVAGEIHLPQPLPALGAGKSLTLTLAAPKGEPQTIAIGTDLLPVERHSGDWQGVPVIRVETSDHLEPPDPAGWRGPLDLSAQASFAWDDGNLYVRVCVTDDKHVPDSSSDLHQGDSLQIAIRGGQEREYRIALGQQEEMRMVGGADPMPQAKVKRLRNSTDYEIAFPWTSLGSTPRPGLVCSLNFAVVENDGAGRKYALVLAPGMTGSKRVYRDCFLSELR